MKALHERIKFIYDGGCVKRYHTKPTIRENTVGQHSFGVAMFCYLLAGESTTPHLLLAALSHDLAEQVTGDISSPTKRKYPDLAAKVQELEYELLGENNLFWEEHALSKEEVETLKLADCLDGMMFCISERSLGNASIADVYHRYYHYCQFHLTTPRRSEVLAAVHHLWRACAS